MNTTIERLPIYVREANPHDYPAICQLMKNELGYSNLHEAKALERLEQFRQNRERATFVAVMDDEIAGFIGVIKSMAYTDDGYYMEIAALAVSAITRRLGVGTALLKKTEEWARLSGIYEIGLHSNMRRIEAHLFYEKNGYTKKSYWFYKNLSE